jgi:hypothetical protein
MILHQVSFILVDFPPLSFSLFAVPVSNKKNKGDIKVCWQVLGNSYTILTHSEVCGDTGLLQFSVVVIYKNYTYLRIRNC